MNPLWRIRFNPKNPGHSLILYKGEPMGFITDMNVGLESKNFTGTDDKGNTSTTTIFLSRLNLTILAQDIVIETVETVEAPPAPAQQELPLGLKKD